ncbi:DUF6233 domain-containing protein [Streptomyces sp. NPDC004096]
MPDLPLDPDRLRAILRWLDEQVAENETVSNYLRLQLDAVREALTRAEDGQSALQPERPAPQPKAPPRGDRSTVPLHTFTRQANGASTGFTLERRAQAVGDERVLIHTADCSHAGPAQPIGDHAGAALVARVEACPFCRPDAELGMEK